MERGIAMESKDPVPRLYLRIAGVDLAETTATEDGEAKPSLLWSMGTVLVSGSFALTLACGPPPDEGTVVAPMAVVSRTEGSCEIEGGDPAVAGGDGKDGPCTASMSTSTGKDGTSTGTKTTGNTSTSTGKDGTSTGTKTTGDTSTTTGKDGTSTGTKTTGDTKKGPTPS
jgi:hypothetical protein